VTANTWHNPFDRTATSCYHKTRE